jgi:GNAT superfamily N-acetyltransferase
MIAEVDDNHIEAAADLLWRFFREEAFVGDREFIRANLDALRNDPHYWAVTTMLYVECGRLGEIGDLFVMPASRMKVEAPIHWCRSHGCSALAVTITREGETRYGLSQFYARFGFTPTDRKSSVLRFNPAPRSAL